MKDVEIQQIENRELRQFLQTKKDEKFSEKLTALGSMKPFAT